MAAKKELKERLSKGVDAYFSGMMATKPSGTNNEPTNSHNESVMISDELPMINEHLSVMERTPKDSEESLITDQSSLITDQGGKTNVEREVLAIAIEEAKKNPRVPLWSEVAKTMLLYNQMLREKRLVRPKISLSEEGSEILDKAMREASPEMWELVEKELNKTSTARPK